MCVRGCGAVTDVGHGRKDRQRESVLFAFSDLAAILRELSEVIGEVSLFFCFATKRL